MHSGRSSPRSEELIALVEQQAARTEELQAEVAELKRPQGRNSRNSALSLVDKANVILGPTPGGRQSRGE